MEIILASASPNRREILAGTGLPFSVVVSNIAEDVDKTLPPDRYVMALALRKAEAVAADHPDACVIGADTVVELDGTILGKPHTPENAVRFLTAMQGRSHAVYTGIAVIAHGSSDVRYERTDVRFAPMSPEEIRWYVSTGEPLEKAGAYGVQGAAGFFVSSVTGDYFNVVGLPIQLLYRMLREAGVLALGTVPSNE